MAASTQFKRLFPHEKPVIAMLHLAGDSRQNKIDRAMSELDCLVDCGVDGAIVENYHGSVGDVIAILGVIASKKDDIVLGVNMLPNNFSKSILIADAYGARFIQLDYVAGSYERNSSLPLSSYFETRELFPDIAVLGGVHPKYYTPVAGSKLEDDVLKGRGRATAIVVTGAGTGQETPIEKIRTFRRILGDYPLIVGAGMTAENAAEQLSVADGVIVGSYLKGIEYKDGSGIRTEYDTKNPINPLFLKRFMTAVNTVRSQPKPL